MIKQICDIIWEVAVNNPDGFTVDLHGLPITKGFSVGFKETQNSFGRQGLERCVEHAIKHNAAIGGWKTPEGLQFDSVAIVREKSEAIRLGAENEQYSIYDLNTQTEIRI